MESIDGERKTRTGRRRFFPKFPKTAGSLSWRGIISPSVKDAIHTTVLHTVGLACSLLCFDFVYYSPDSPREKTNVVPRFLPSTPLSALPFSWASPSSPTLYDEAVRSLRRSVFTNFISFLWGIKSSRSRPTEEGRGSRERIEHSVEGVGWNGVGVEAGGASPVSF